MDLFHHLSDQTSLLTPNRRLSAALIKKHHQWQIAQGKSCWPSLDSLPMNSWVQRLWQSYAVKQIVAMPMQLSTQQELLLWEEILRQSKESEYLLQLSHAAELAQSAFGILKQWRVKLDHPALNTTEDGMIFQKWAVQFQEALQRKHWLASDSLIDHVAEKIETGDITPPPHLLLTGFTEISPQSRHLFDACEQRGTRMTYYQSKKPHHLIQRISLNDEETEIRTMARWAKARFENYPHTSIGCIVPHLEKCRDRVVHIFSEVFSDQYTYTLNEITLPFNISAGINLSRYPVIHTALALLSLSADNIPLETFSHFLRTPFIGEAEQEMIQRAQFENVLRHRNTQQISLTQTADMDQLASHCPMLANRFKQYLYLKTNKKQKLAISEWISIFVSQLTALGWPGERSINSQEYQVVQRWLDLLNEYAKFDNLLAAQSQQQALAYLIRLATDTIFQIQSPEAPVQILGLLEATELPFDALWVMGLDDTAWPPFPKPNPFIPQRLQKTLHMPHATAERELVYCQDLTEQLKQSAEYVIFSYAKQNDEAELRPSPLIKDSPEIQLSDIQLSDFTSLAKTVYDSRAIELIQDELAPTIHGNDRIRGGARVFKLQAACPFKAFAELRLDAKPLETITLGLRAQERGSIVHKALETIWKTLQNQEALLQIDSDDLQRLIQDSIQQSIRLVAGDLLHHQRYLSLESQRLQKIIENWLMIEKTRPNFKISALEQEQKTTIANIPITLRIDRIDELSNGDRLIIDYKTGKNNTISAWFGARPDEPQLPLYCVTETQAVAGIVFAELHPEEMTFKGVSKNPLGLNAVKTLSEIKLTDANSWEEQTQQWRASLTHLGNEFANGVARVNPKDVVETCRHCDLHAFCRIHEAVGDKDE